MGKQKSSAQIIYLAQYAKARQNAANQILLRTAMQKLCARRPLRRGGVLGWFQARKRAVQRLRNLSAGKLELAEGGYRGDEQRHWLRNLECGHVFTSSLRELATTGFGTEGAATFAKEACPFCSEPRDLARCGSVPAVQELVWNLSNGKISFDEDNVLTSQDALFWFGCEIHGFRFEHTFSEFLACMSNNGEFCHLCDFEKNPPKWQD